MNLKYKARFVEFTGRSDDKDFSHLNGEFTIDEVRSRCKTHGICADLYSVADGSFTGSVLETGMIYSNLSE